MVRNRRRPSQGFTLVELLVVIGIIALLIGILLPSLARAREHAQLIKCLSVQRSLLQAVLIQANEHKGYAQPAGLFSSGVTAFPLNMGDPYQTRYQYFQAPAGLRPVPFFAACAQTMGQKLNGNSLASMQAALQSDYVRKLSTCPSQVTPTTGVTEADTSGYTGPSEPSSYCLNEEVLGFRDWSLNTPRGKVTAVRRPSTVMLFCDGLPRQNTTRLIYTIFAQNASQTLADYARIERTPKYNEMDYIRHNGLVNVGFCDGHAATFAMGKPDRSTVGQIDQVGVSRGIYAP